MKSDTHFNLGQLYAQALEYTEQATVAVELLDFSEAESLLGKRKALVRSIQREMHSAPAWGSNAALDAAALSFIKADNLLEMLLANV